MFSLSSMFNYFFKPTQTDTEVETKEMDDESDSMVFSLNVLHQFPPKKNMRLGPFITYRDGVFIHFFEENFQKNPERYKLASSKLRLSVQKDELEKTWEVIFPYLAKSRCFLSFKIRDLYEVLDNENAKYEYFSKTKQAYETAKMIFEEKENNLIDRLAEMFHTHPDEILKSINTFSKIFNAHYLNPNSGIMSFLTTEFSAEITKEQIKQTKAQLGILFECYRKKIEAKDKLEDAIGKIEQSNPEENRRLIDNGQITIYIDYLPYEFVDIDVNDELEYININEITDNLIEIETALIKAGISPNEPPDSDIKIKDSNYFSMRVDQIKQANGKYEYVAAKDLTEIKDKLNQENPLINAVQKSFSQKKQNLALSEISDIEPPLKKRFRYN